MSPVNPWMILPFVLFLLSIALLPFISKPWWEKNYTALSVLFALSTILYYIVGLDETGRVLRTGREYLSFIMLIGSLFVVAGGIHIRIRGNSTPLLNVAVLGIGAVLSNLLGTTGASMVLIRPFLRVNRRRLRGFHVVFFIFIVSNIGGALTPIGDPPLFLGYLRGVPFFWVLGSVWHIWALTIGLVLAVFFALDLASFRKFEAAGVRERDLHEEAEVTGLPNVFFLAVILLAVFIERPVFLREAIMLAAACGSYLTTRPDVHRKNGFTLRPLREVAVLFVGIFATMMPALDWLEANASRIGLSTPGQFYWGTGILSSLLDNAPTYLSFLSASVGLLVSPETAARIGELISAHVSAPAAGLHSVEIGRAIDLLAHYHPAMVAAGSAPADDIRVAYIMANHGIFLKAISVAAVFFGSNTYIGNGPNLLVKSIAEEAGAPTPGFLGYMVRYSLPVLLPIFALVWWLFFRG